MPAQAETASRIRTRALEQILRVVAGFAADIGASRAEINRAFRSARLGARKRGTTPIEFPQYRQLQAYADLLRAWFSEPPYLDADGDPRTLLLDDAREFAGLARRFVPAQPVAATAEALVLLGVITRRSDARLQPKRRALLIPALSAASLERIPVLLRGVLSTIAHNITRKEGKSAGRLERTAITTRLPAHRVPEFESQTRRLANTFIEQTDAWMMKREVPQGDELPRKSDEFVRAGVSVFAYVEPTEGGRTHRRARGRRRGARG